MKGRRAALITATDLVIDGGMTRRMIYTDYRVCRASTRLLRSLGRFLLTCGAGRRL